eukprot:CAMPEP_0117573428 /NCGR_PEP_ID=MMETSP0784-20121206/60951_1 /TAXON_ID=39447 /ORGANISM="" /LENGTH=38 /DNA_ID= /DNA_START= /DNA_END= /DNA_ORIENTATION=
MPSFVKRPLDDVGLELAPQLAPCRKAGLLRVYPSVTSN